MTLGGTGKETGDRHPKVQPNVLIGAGATILGNIQIGMGAQIAAGALVLKAVPPHSVVAGTPAKVVGQVCVRGGHACVCACVRACFGGGGRGLGLTIRFSPFTSEVAVTALSRKILCAGVSLYSVPGTLNPGR